MSCDSGPRDCNFTTAISAAGNFWMTDVQPVGVETISLQAWTMVHMLLMKFLDVMKCRGFCALAVFDAEN